MAMMKIKRGDTVKVIAGADNGKQGKILEIDHKAGRVKVEGVNIVKKHSKPSAGHPNGGSIENEGFIDASNVMLVVKGKTTRVGFREENGKKVRFAKATGDKID